VISRPWSCDLSGSAPGAHPSRMFHELTWLTEVRVESESIISSTREYGCRTMPTPPCFQGNTPMPASEVLVQAFTPRASRGEVLPTCLIPPRPSRQSISRLKRACFAAAFPAQYTPAKDPRVLGLSEPLSASKAGPRGFPGGLFVYLNESGVNAAARQNPPLSVAPASCCRVLQPSARLPVPPLPKITALSRAKSLCIC
jgi:hypothetical protein